MYETSFMRFLKILRRTWIELYHPVKKRIIVLGDSNSLRPGPVDCWPAILNRKTRSGILIINESAEGRTTGHETIELVSRRLPAIRRSVNYVFIMLGTNDAKACYGPTSPWAIRTNLNNIINRIFSQNAEIKIVVLLPPPMGQNPQGDFIHGDIRVRKYCRAIHSLCHERDLPVIDIHSMLKAKEDLEPDSVHLNQSGRQKVADASWNYINRHIAEVI